MTDTKQKSQIAVSVRNISKSFGAARVLEDISFDVSEGETIVERVIVRLDLSTGQPVIVTRPKTETLAFPLHVGQTVTVGLVRFRVLPNFTLASERAGKVI